MEIELLYRYILQQDPRQLSRIRGSEAIKNHPVNEATPEFSPHVKKHRETWRFFSYTNPLHSQAGAFVYELLAFW